MTHPRCKTCRYARPLQLGVCTVYIECTNEDEIAISNKKRNGTTIHERNAPGCKYYEEDALKVDLDTEEQKRKLFKDLQSLVGKIPPNSYRSIVGQINHGDLEGARIGIRNMRYKLARQKENGHV